MAAVAVPLVVAGIGAGVAIYTQKKQEDAAKAAQSKLPKPIALPLQADQTPLDAQASRRRRLAGGFAATSLTGPQGLGGTVGQRSALLGT